MNERVFKKSSLNPIIKASDLPSGIMYVLNPGVIKHKDEYIMMLDAATLSTPIVFWIARSKDGVNFFPDPKPVSWPHWSNDAIESCVYDPRITFIDGSYIIMYASHVPGRGVRTGIVKTDDFITFTRIEQEETNQENRNSVLFPEKINGLYVRFDRLMSSNELDSSEMSISYSSDLKSWKNSKKLMSPRNASWDSHKIGAGAVPIKTSKGWLEIYHGVDRTCNGFIYRLGTVLLDLKDPSKVIARCTEPVLWPEYDYELMGRVPNVVFTCNAIIEPDDTVKIYYGAADTCIGLAEAKLDDLINACFSSNPHLSNFFNPIRETNNEN